MGRRFTCQLCGRMAWEKESRWMFRRKDQTAVLISALLASYNGSTEFLKGLYDVSASKRLKLCQQHFIDAAQFMGAEMMLAGFKLPYPEDSLHGGPLAFVAPKDIPSSLLQQLNECLQTFDDGLALTSKHVATFMQDSIRRYYTASGWLAGSRQKHDEERRKRKENEGEAIIDADNLTQIDYDARFAEKESMDLEGNFSESYQVKTETEDEQLDTKTCPSSCFPASSLLSFPNDNSELQSKIHSVGYTNDVRNGLPEADLSLLSGFFLVEGVMLLQLFMVCQHCGVRLSPSKVRLTAMGTAPVVHYYCPCCSVGKGGIQRWEGQRRTVEQTYERPFLGNVLAAVSAVITGTRFFELQRWAKQLRLSFISNSFFWKWFLLCKPSIEKVYSFHQEKVFDVIRGNYSKRDGLLIAAGSSFGSRGRELIGRVSIADLRTKLVLHTETLHCLGTNSSREMELEGLRRLLQWLLAERWRISSITTDINRSFPSLIDATKQNLRRMQHLWDGRLLLKLFARRLKKLARQNDCAPITKWYKKLKAHLREAIDTREGKMVPQFFNAFLKHVKDVHEWPVEEVTGRVRRCSHPPLKGPLPNALVEGSPALEKLRQIVLNKTFQADLVKASKQGGSSIFKLKKVLDRLYCKKNIFYPLFTYKLFAMMSTMHYNSLILAEIAGERKIQRVFGSQRKLFRRSRTVFKTPVEQLWRDQIVEAVLEGCQFEEVPLEEMKYDADQLQEALDVDDAYVGGETEGVDPDYEPSDEEYDEENEEELL